MKRGHVTGTKREKPQRHDWYAAIQAAHLARIEREWYEQHGDQQAAHLAQLEQEWYEQQAAKKEDAWL
jgi:hypothetical protein